MGILQADDHAVATLSYDDADFNLWDTSHGTSRGADFCASAQDVTFTDFANPHGFTSSGQPMKPCATWCHLTGGLCGRVLTITGLLQTYDELHLRQYGSIQEIWVQLMYAYQESFDANFDETVFTSTAGIAGVESPFPNVFFSAPEVVEVQGYCDVDNYKCRGYYSDENQPYGGSRLETQRVYDNLTPGYAGSEFGAGANDYHSDSVYPSNVHTAPLT